MHDDRIGPVRHVIVIGRRGVQVFAHLPQSTIRSRLYMLMPLKVVHARCLSLERQNSGNYLAHQPHDDKNRVPFWGHGPKNGGVSKVSSALPNGYQPMTDKKPLTLHEAVRAITSTPRMRHAEEPKAVKEHGPEPAKVFEDREKPGQW